MNILATAPRPRLPRWISPPGRRLGSGIGAHRNGEFLQFLRTIGINVPGALDVRPVDNYAVHKTPSTRACFSRHHVRLTPNVGVLAEPG